MIFFEFWKTIINKSFQIWWEEICWKRINGDESPFFKSLLNAIMVENIIKEVLKEQFFEVMGKGHQNMDIVTIDTRSYMSTPQV